MLGCAGLCWVVLACVGSCLPRVGSCWLCWLLVLGRVGCVSCSCWLVLARVGRVAARVGRVAARVVF